ncbi:MAG: hypothetical protein IKF90_19265 [Parasporobacterium sp.]|nr:hypothetical protein [Parasporobacterium sp.]
MKKNIALKILALLLCLIFVFSLTSCRFPKIGRRQNQPEQPETSVSEQPTEKPESVSSSSQTQKESLILDYYHYDPQEFYEAINKMLVQYEKGDSEGVQKLYSELLDELKEINDLYGIAYIKYTENVNDTYYNEESDYENELSLTAVDRLFTACHEMATGKTPEVFTGSLDEEHISYFEKYVPLTKEQIAMEVRENDLVQQYYSQYDDMDDISCTIGGKEYHFSDILGDEAEKLATLNPDLYSELFQTCLKEFNKQVGETFLELLALRAELAKSYGYDNYADYADKEIYFRDYSTQDIAGFKDVVKRYAQNILYYQYAFPAFNVLSLPKGSADLKKTGEVLAGFSDYTEKAYQYLTENNLFSIGPESERMDGAYTMYLPGRDLPYLFMRTNEKYTDALSFSHEFGHFTAYHFTTQDIVTDQQCLDIAEAHSQGLALLFSGKTESVFGTDPKAIQTDAVLKIAGNIINGCVLDDWQREVYANPDMTLDEINDCYKRFLQEYGTEPYPGMEYLWCEYSHNFEVPMYCFGYASSSMGALQIWQKSLENFEDGVSSWEKLVELGPYCKYADAMEKAGLKPFYDVESSDKVLSDTLFYVVQAYYQSALE